MIDERKLKVTMLQLGRVMEGFEGLKDELLEKNPKLFAIMSESCVDLIGRLRNEIIEMLPPEMRDLPRGNTPSAAFSTLPPSDISAPVIESPAVH